MGVTGEVGVGDGGGDAVEENVKENPPWGGVVGAGVADGLASVGARKSKLGVVVDAVAVDDGDGIDDVVDAGVVDGSVDDGDGAIKQNPCGGTGVDVGVANANPLVVVVNGNSAVAGFGSITFPDALAGFASLPMLNHVMGTCLVSSCFFVGGIGWLLVFT